MISWVIVEGKFEVVGWKVFVYDVIVFFWVLIWIIYNNFGVDDDVSCEDCFMDVLREEFFFYVKIFLYVFIF